MQTDTAQTAQRAEPAAPLLQRLQRYGLISLGLGALLTVGFAVLLGVQQFFQGYLIAFLFWFGLSLGSLAVLMIHHLAGGGWSFTIRRPLEAGALLTPLVGLLFLPVLLPIGMESVYYYWFNYTGDDALILHKTQDLFNFGIGGWLSHGYFALRAVIYVVLWTGMAILFRTWSVQQDAAKDGDFRAASNMRKLAGLGIVVYVITMTLASVDFAMSIEPHFFSMIYGVLFMVGQGLSIIASMILLLAYIGRTADMQGAVTVRTTHDVGKMMLGFVVLWAYVSYGQYVIIWSGNLPEFTPWYISRTEAGWNVIALALILFHFVVPFFVLLSRKLKQSLRLLWSVAALVTVMRLVDLYWLIAPDFYTEGFYLNPMYLTCLLMIGGLWLTGFAYLLQRRPLLVTNELRRDPRVVKKGAAQHA